MRGAACSQSVKRLGRRRNKARPELPRRAGASQLARPISQSLTNLGSCRLAGALIGHLCRSQLIQIARAQLGPSATRAIASAPNNDTHTAWKRLAACATFSRAFQFAQMIQIIIIIIIVRRRRRFSLRDCGGGFVAVIKTNLAIFSCARASSKASRSREPKIYLAARRASVRFSLIGFCACVFKSRPAVVAPAAALSASCCCRQARNVCFFGCAAAAAGCIGKAQQLILI